MSEGWRTNGGTDAGAAPPQGRRVRTAGAGGPAGLVRRADRAAHGDVGGHKVLVPAPVAGYVERPALERRCEAMEHRFTMLLAPGGFGKTALLARCCRRLRKRGVAAAWLGVDEDDGGANLAAHLATAFERAGLVAVDADRADDPTAGVGGEPEARGVDRVGALMRAVERHGRPCVLAIDEAERLQADAVAVLNAVFRRAPRNLHFAVAARERPPGLDIAMYFLEGHGTTVTVDDLRFSRAETAAVLGGRLSRREFNAVVEATSGWPVAVRMVRNAREHGSSALEGNTVAGWIEARLWRGLPAEDRDLLLDMALFDWFDPALLDEATGSHDAAQRIASVDAVTGLLQTVGGAAATLRLHPLIRGYCAARRAREDPARSRRINAGIAGALAHRGHVVDALRHAALAGDARLAGRIAENAGGIRLAVRQGFDSLNAVVDLLQAEVFGCHPRLAVARCLALALRGEVARAEQEYRCAAAATSAFTRDRADGDDRALAADHVVLRGMLDATGCRLDGMKRVGIIAAAAAGARRRGIAPELRAMASFGLCLAQSAAGAFDEALASAERARTLSDPGLHLAPRIAYETGCVAMCRGRPDDAAAAYEQGLRMARSLYRCDPGAVAMGEILREELAMERHGAVLRRKPGAVPLRLLGASGASFQTLAAAVGVGVDAALAHGAPDQALALLEDVRTYALRTRRPPLARLVAVLRVAALLAAGRVGMAARAWTAADLPVEVADCLDMDRRGWRVAEVTACTRIRLCVALGEPARARELARELRDTAAARDLRRTLMRAEALSMAVEHAAGDVDAARRHLRAFAECYAQSRYAGALVGEARVGRALLAQFEDAAVPGAVDELAALLGRATGEDRRAARTLNDGELAVLGCLARGLQDKRIAAELHLSVDGVRHRLRRIFAKVGARSRDDAVHRAREQGVLASANEPSPRA